MGRRRILTVFIVVAFSVATSLCQAGAKLPIYDAATAAELLRAIGPNRVIRLTGTEYRLTECADLSQDKNPYVSWEKTFDGPQMSVAGVSNLTIRGTGNTPAHLVIEPRYAYVIHFFQTRNLTLENVRAGHTATGYCEGGVFHFEAGKNIRVNRSILYGCGTEGLRLEEVKGFSGDEITIADCSYYIMTVMNSTEVSFVRSIFIDNAEFEGIRIVGCNRVLFDRCEIRRNGSETPFDTGLFHVFNSDGVTVKDSIIEENTASYLLIGDKEIEWVGTVVRNNRFAGKFRKATYGQDWEVY